MLFFKTATILSFGCSLALAQSGPESPAKAVPVTMVVTAEPSPPGDVPPIVQVDVSVLQNQMPVPVTEWLPLDSTMDGLELYILIDDKINPSAARLDEIRRFISAQPVDTAVGVAFMEDGSAHIVQVPTKDHDLAAKALRLPSGNDSAAASPFFSLSALIDHWPQGALRREVVLVTDGMDAFDDVGDNAYLDLAVRDALRSEVEVFCLYAPGSDSANSPTLIRGGQGYLAELARLTGGESYFKEGESSPSFEPYLADISWQLANQYRVTFMAAPEDGLQSVVFQTQVPNVSMVAAHGFYLSPAQVIHREEK